MTASSLLVAYSLDKRLGGTLCTQWRIWALR